MTHRTALVESLLHEALAIDTTRLLTPQERALLEQDLRAFLEGSPQGQALLRALDPAPIVTESGDVPRGAVAPAPVPEAPHAASAAKRGTR